MLCTSPLVPDVEVQSTYALLVDLDDNTIVTQRNARDRINPASMTKIMTVLVAAEHVTDLEDTFTITRDVYKRQVWISLIPTGEMFWCRADLWKNWSR